MRDHPDFEPTRDNFHAAREVLEGAETVGEFLGAARIVRASALHLASIARDPS